MSFEGPTRGKSWGLCHFMIPRRSKLSNYSDIGVGYGFYVTRDRVCTVNPRYNAVLKIGIFANFGAKELRF